MKLIEVKEIAKGMGISPKRMNKAQIIREIQTQEGNSACFDASVQNCGQEDCLWRDDCTCV
ncbi:MAG: hypothetical protein H6Q65_1718 [Firmicutes bacterium]|nr:hypothetical protein [Bacillota bacterium]